MVKLFPKAIFPKAIIPRATVPKATVFKAIVFRAMVPRAVVLRAVVSILSKKLKGIDQLTVVIYLIPLSFKRRSRLNSLSKPYMFTKLPILPKSPFFNSY